MLEECSGVCVSEVGEGRKGEEEAIQAVGIEAVLYVNCQATFTLSTSCQ